MKMNKKFNFVEVGPGRGTLLCDIFRVFSRFPPLYNAMSVHLVEVSPTMRALQKETIAKTAAQLNLPVPTVQWHDTLTSVPRDEATLLLAHEFLDALPVHQFCMANDQWHEILVDSYTPDGTSDTQLRFVKSPKQTITQTAYLPLVGDLADRQFVEVCPQALVFMDEVCARISENRGAALIVDYGHLGEKGDTLRGFRRHEVCDPLEDPGKTDLTCDVDFSLLRRRACSSEYADGGGGGTVARISHHYICNHITSLPMPPSLVKIHGPEPQAYFLINMGLLTRLKALLGRCKSQKHRDELLSGCEMLITEEQMGSRFKFLAIVSEATDANGHPRRLPGFTDLPGTPYAMKP